MYELLPSFYQKGGLAIKHCLTKNMDLSGDYIEEEKVRVIANELGWLYNEWGTVIGFKDNLIHNTAIFAGYSVTQQC